MAENIGRSSGQPRNYKFNRGGMPTEFGPFIGTVTNNVDPTRNGRLQVYIEQFSGPDPSDKSLWRTVSYCPPFYGATPKSGSSAGTGNFAPGNQMSYGMWFTPPDIGVQVLCFFVAGDPNQGYYIGCVPEQGINHMIPAIGATDKYQFQNKNQETYFADAPLMPVTEINNAPENTAIAENPKFFDQKKPVHSYVAAILFNQGLSFDPIRGPIGSTSQRESPSACYGISTPGRAIYDGGLEESTVKQRLETGSLKPEDVKVIGRRGGHTLVMDDGDLEGVDSLVRIRTAKGHQITMSDDGNCFYITHANGQTWLEFGQEGTVDVYATNSVNVRTQGTINLHADQDINMFAGGKINMKSIKGTTLESDGTSTISSKQKLILFSRSKIGVKSNGSLALVSDTGSWSSGESFSVVAGLIDLNGGSTESVSTPSALTKYVMPDSEFNSTLGWGVKADALESIVTRAPTHEPWPYHNQGVAVNVKLEESKPTQPPGAPEVPEGWSITAQ